jgi:hypothetical protein
MSITLTTAVWSFFTSRKNVKQEVEIDIKLYRDVFFKVQRAILKTEKKILLSIVNTRKIQSSETKDLTWWDIKFYVQDLTSSKMYF